MAHGFFMYPDHYATDVFARFDENVERWVRLQLEYHLKPEPIKVVLKNRRNGLQFESLGTRPV